MVNPYQSPGLASDESIPRRSLIRAVRIMFGMINLSVAGLFVIPGVFALFTPSSKWSMGEFSALVMAPIFGAYAALEVMAFARTSVERKLGYANLACAAFDLFGIITNTSEAISRPPIAWGFLFVFLPIAGGIAIYLLSCGWVRIRIEVDP